MCPCQLYKERPDLQSIGHQDYMAAGMHKRQYVNDNKEGAARKRDTGLKGHYYYEGVWRIMVQVVGSPSLEEGDKDLQLSLLDVRSLLCPHIPV